MQLGSGAPKQQKLLPALTCALALVAAPLPVRADALSEAGLGSGLRLTLDDETLAPDGRARHERTLAGDLLLGGREVEFEARMLDARTTGNPVLDELSLGGPRLGRRLVPAAERSERDTQMRIPLFGERVHFTMRQGWTRETGDGGIGGIGREGQSLLQRVDATLFDGERLELQAFGAYGRADAVVDALQLEEVGAPFADRSRHGVQAGARARFGRAELEFWRSELRSLDGDREAFRSQRAALAVDLEHAAAWLGAAAPHQLDVLMSEDGLVDDTSTPETRETRVGLSWQHGGGDWGLETTLGFSRSSGGTSIARAYGGGIEIEYAAILPFSVALEYERGRTSGGEVDLSDRFDVEFGIDLSRLLFRRRFSQAEAELGYSYEGTRDAAGRLHQHRFLATFEIPY